MFHQIYKVWLLKLVAENGNYKKVARIVNISVSALSQSLKSLEDYLEKRLLLKTDDGFKLSAEGEALVEYFSDTLSTIKDFNLQSEEINTKKVVIGAYDSLAINLIPCLFKHMRDEYPNIKFEVTTARSSILATNVRKGFLDMALVIDKEESDSYFSDIIYENGLNLYVNSEVKRTIKNPIQELGIGTITSVGDGHPYFYTKFLKDFEIDLRAIKFTCDSFETIRKVTSNGHAVGILPIDVAMRDPNLVELFDNVTKDKLAFHSVCLISRKTINENLKKEMVKNLKEVWAFHDEKNRR